MNFIKHLVLCVFSLSIFLPVQGMDNKTKSLLDPSVTMRWFLKHILVGSSLEYIDAMCKLGQKTVWIDPTQKKCPGAFFSIMTMDGYEIIVPDYTQISVMKESTFTKLQLSPFKAKTVVFYCLIFDAFVDGQRSGLSGLENIKGVVAKMGEIYSKLRENNYDAIPLFDDCYKFVERIGCCKDDHEDEVGLCLQQFQYNHLPELITQKT